MGEIYLMTTIAPRKTAGRFMEFYKQYGAGVCAVALGRGTASGKILGYLGLEEDEKAVIFSVVTGPAWSRIRRGLEREFRIDVPGTGIAFTIPLSSIGGRRELEFLTENQEYVKGEESTLKGTKHELLVVIANYGYNDLVMQAANAGGATGGTVLHARGVGLKSAEKFLGVSLASEKEMILIVTKTERKNAIMRSIMDRAGLATKAMSVVFSLPVTGTAGLRLLEEEEGTLSDEAEG